nr:NAD-glutamate dehydrogenase domain-containing protein [Propioniciclava sp. MC1595]
MPIGSSPCCRACSPTWRPRWADWQAMTDRVAEIASALSQGPELVSGQERRETAALLEWLLDDHFIFLGYRRYTFTDAPAGGLLEQVPGSGLGLLRKEGGHARRRLHQRLSGQVRHLRARATASGTRPARVASPSPRGEASNEAASRSQARAMPA